MTRDSLAKATGVINYTISVVDGTEAGTGKKGLINLTGASVTVSQFGKVTTVQTDATGRAFFTDLRAGSVSISVNLANYASVDAIATLSASTGSALTQVATQIPLLATSGANMATITGTVTGELDLTNESPEPISGVEVSASLNAGQLNTLFGISSSYYGPNNNITKYTISSVVGKTTTDANGVYSIKVPSMSNGLQYSINMTPVKKSQTIIMDYMNGKFFGTSQKIDNVTFSTDGVNYSSIPGVSPAYAVISAPDGTSTKGTGAIAQAVLGGGSIEAISITGNNTLFSQAPRISVTDAKGSGFQSAPVLLNGSMSSISISNTGANYVNPSINIVDHDDDATSIASVNVDENTYGVTNVSFTDNSNCIYTSAPTITVNEPAIGSGLKVTPIMVTANSPIANAMRIAGITVTATGTGYVYKTSNNTLYDPTFTISGGNPSTTQPSISVSKRSFTISKISVSAAGSGYTASPFFIMGQTSGGNMSVQPDLTGALTSGSISSITINNGGQADYPIQLIQVKTMKDPTLSYSSSTYKNGFYYYFPYSASKPSIANIQSPKTIASISVLNGGTGYDPANPPSVIISGSKVNGQPDVTATTTVDANGHVTAVTIASNGTSKFTSLPNVKIADMNTNNMSAIQAVCGVIVDPNGTVTELNFSKYSYSGGITPGAGYRTFPTITIYPTVSGMGSGATVNVTGIDPSTGAITSWKVNNGGSGYFGANKTATGKTFNNNGYYYQTSGATIITPAFPSNGTVTVNAGKTVLVDAYLGSGARPNVSK